MAEQVNMEEAVAWARRYPDPMPSKHSVLELRPVFEAADFAELDPSGGLREEEGKLRKRVEAKTNDAAPATAIVGRRARPGAASSLWDVALTSYAYVRCTIHESIISRETPQPATC